MLFQNVTNHHLRLLDIANYFPLVAFWALSFVIRALLKKMKSSLPAVDI